MRPRFFRSLLLILLLAFAGLASAVPCVERGELAPVFLGADAAKQKHCSSDISSACSNEHSGNCGTECSCCPGLSNSLATLSDSKPTFTRQSLRATTYSRFKSPPELDTELRPPIVS
ncbi:hypothetical protein [Microbulbifer epialgicus]|uniref:Secreted protein n=1 Tax=Microbulbifer epialgicus TaxID=393907 RepID=A0ABV4P0N1_9GAMM